MAPGHDSLHQLLGYSFNQKNIQTLNALIHGVSSGNSHILQYGEYYGYESIDHYLKPGDSCPKGFYLLLFSTRIK